MAIETQSIPRPHGPVAASLAEGRISASTGPEDPSFRFLRGNANLRLDFKENLASLALKRAEGGAPCRAYDSSVSV